MRRRGGLATEPAVHAEALGDRLEPCLPHPGRGSCADGERRARSGWSVHHRDRDRDVQEAAPVDHVESQAGRGEESPVERAQRLVVGPVEQGKREAALPPEHHGVALDQLEERGKDRLAEGGSAGEPAARRVADRARGPRLTQVDELCREVRRRAVRERHSLDELRLRVLGERGEGEASLCVLQSDGRARTATDRPPRPRAPGPSSAGARRRGRTSPSTARSPRRSRRRGRAGRSRGPRSRTRRSPLRACGVRTRARRRSSEEASRRSCTSSRRCAVTMPTSGETAPSRRSRASSTGVKRSGASADVTPSPRTTARAPPARATHRPDSEGHAARDRGTAGRTGPTSTA